MTRFSHLEFGEEERRHREPSAPRDEHHYLALADEACAQGKFEAALRHYSRAMEMNSALDRAWLGQVQVLIEMNTLREARVWAEKGLEQFPDHPELLAAKGVVAARSGEAAKGLDYSDAAMQKKGETAYRWRARGDVLIAAGPGREEVCFQRAIALEREAWLGHVWIARAYAFYRKFARALGHAQRAVELKADSVLAWLEAGRCQEALGMAAAAAAYTRVLELEPGRAAAQEGLSRLESEPSFLRWFRALWSRRSR